MFNIANIKPLAGRGLLLVQKHSPEILTGIGVVGVIAAGVMASRATLKLPAIIDNKNHMIEAIRAQAAADIKTEEEANEDEVNLDSLKVIENHKNKLVATSYIKTSLDVIKIYGPAVTVGVGSIACILGAHGIMRRRNAALAAAYQLVDSTFKEYRKRVADELGEEKELDIRYDRKEETVVDEETGEEKSVKRAYPNKSPYAKFFDEMSSQWEKDPDYNLTFLTVVQNKFNNELHKRGHVFLNEVYDALDIPRTQAGNQVGWLSDGAGDNHIDFGIYDFENEKAREFVNGHERSILLDFNVDGPILHLI